MVHPVQSVIESLYAAGRCPRLHVDATHASVTVPDFIRQQWRERLIIDLDASYPLDLVFGENGLAADLSFGGHVTRCSFPWESIYIVTDRSTGRGIVLDRHVPESVRRQAAGQQPAPSFEAAKAEPPPEPRPELRRVEAEPALETTSSEDAPPAAAPSPSDDQAKKRRAAFRVIDGGG
jgi:stringent starvation protein B